MDDYTLITTTDALAEYCDQISHCSLIAIDTEFLRERTYFPLLCLVQIASLNGNALIDPLADGISLEPLKAVLTDQNITKIFHSGDQDVELFYYALDVVPTPIFDTQIASLALGVGDGIAYNNLVQQMLDIRLDKSMQYTHWDKRPLSDAQLTYALADVTHLLTLTPTLMQRLKDRGRTDWIVESHAHLVDPGRFNADIKRIVGKIRHNLRKPVQHAAIYALAQWREDEAIRVNKPRGFIIKDEVLVEIAKRMPETPEVLGSMRLLTPIKNPERRAHIISLLDKVRNSDPSTYPTPPHRPDAKPNNELVGLLSLVLKHHCSVEQISARLIANRKDLEQVALGRTDLPCMQGWRFDIFGKYAKQLMDGKLNFHWDHKGEQVVMD